MTFRDDLKTFLVSDIATQLSAFATPSAPTVYSGQLDRINFSDFDVRVRYVSRNRLQRETGLTRHLVEVQIMIFGHDEDEEDNLAAVVESAVETLVGAYDGGRSTFAAGLTSYQIERVRAFRFDPLQMDQRRRRRRLAVVRLQVDEWEA